MKPSGSFRLSLIAGLCALLVQTAIGQTARRGLERHTPLAGSGALAGPPLPGGTYTVGSGGFFPTLDSAFSRLGSGGILGAVTLSLTDTLYVASASRNGTFTLQGPVSGSGPAARISIRPADNTAVTIQGNGESAILFRNVSYLTLDGISLEGNTRLDVHALYNPTGTRWNDAVDFIGNDDFDIISNLTIRSDDMRLSSGVLLWADSLGAPDSCLISGVRVRSAMLGLYIAGWGTNYSRRPGGNIIRNNQVGSPTDSLIAWGIQDEGADWTLIENNRVENLSLNLTSVGVIDRYLVGINSYFGMRTVIRNNMVYNLRPASPTGYRSGILASGMGDQRGYGVRIYNNMVYDLRTGIAGQVTSEMSGIRAWQQDWLTVDNNTVHLTGLPEGTSAIISAAARFSSTAATPTLRNNILVNTRNDPGCAALIMEGGPWASNYNDLYVDPSGNGVIGRTGSGLYKSLTDWRTNGSDQNSVSVIPAFCDLPCLHVDSTASSSKLLDGHGMVIPGILYDFDGQVRNAVTPDIGADEFSWIAVAVGKTEGLPEAFTLGQNYPNPFNPSTTIRYGLPQAQSVRLAVYNPLGQEVAVLAAGVQEPGYHEVHFDGSGLASGVYFYRLQAGSFVQSRRLLLLR